MKNTQKVNKVAYQWVLGGLVIHVGLFHCMLSNNLKMQQCLQKIWKELNYKSQLFGNKGADSSKWLLETQNKGSSAFVCLFVGFLKVTFSGKAHEAIYLVAELLLTKGKVTQLVRISLGQHVKC